MSTQLRVGNAFGTTVSIHLCWLWLLPFAVFTLVFLGVEPLLEAIVTSLLLFGSVLLATLATLRAARRVGLTWRAATIFPLGAVVRRERRSTPAQEARIASARLAVHAALALLFGGLWYMLPAGALGVEMEIVSLFNLGMLLFSLLLRLSPNHDNLLHAALAARLDSPIPHRVLSTLHTIALVTFAASSILMLGVGWLAFGWWFAMAGMLSQLTTVAEEAGEYRELSSAEPPTSSAPVAANPLNTER